MRKSAEFSKKWDSVLPSLGPDYRLAAGSLFQRWGLLQLLGGNAKAANSSLFIAERYFTTLTPNREIGIELAKNYYFRAEAYRQLKEFDLSISNFTFAFLIAETLGTPEIHWVYSGAGRTYADMGNYQAALNVYRKAFAVLENVQSSGAVGDTKISILDSSAYVYRQYISLLLSLYQKSGEPSYRDEAFEFTQRGKARVFLEMLLKANAGRQNSSGQYAALESQLDQKIAKIHNQLRSVKLFDSEGRELLDQLQTLRDQQVKVDHDSSQTASGETRKALFRPAKIGEIQAMLSRDDVLFEYVESDTAITLWTITKAEVRQFVISLDHYADISLYLQTLRLPLIGSGELRQHVELGERLHRILVEPAAELLQGKKRLIIAPDGKLHYLPFETLIGSTAGSSGTVTSISAVPYLIKDLSISYVASASAFVEQLTATARKASPKLPLLAFGDPVYRTETVKGDQGFEPEKVLFARAALKRLEFSGDEILRIAQVWGVPSKSVHVNLREKATVETLKTTNLTEYGIIHIAAHAILQDEVGLFTQPSLILTNNKSTPSQGVLRLSDILELKQNADLVILSACETGLGQMKNGEGIIGFTRAFLYGGAASTVVSLWKVEDQSTALLMEKFHQRLKRGDSKEEALRQAKLEIMKTRVRLAATDTQESLAAPFFWAPFILVGDRGPINFN